MIGAVDFGRTKIAVGMVDGAGRVLCKMEITDGDRFYYSDGLDLAAAMLLDTARNANGEVSYSEVSIRFQGVIGQLEKIFKKAGFATELASFSDLLVFFCPQTLRL
jgi:hypothetical protein